MQPWFFFGKRKKSYTSSPDFNVTSFERPKLVQEWIGSDPNLFPENLPEVTIYYLIKNNNNSITNWVAKEPTAWANLNIKN